ncbi:uncharacterized protein LOC124144180 [Haliotis rufescens]|uniref:uncharacterized protein LOC124144180 n=1 Tax=Haliotis rufescens TaxID=6454 RepID=UPI001EB0A85A|nr:uncharacterized protein LOC124144180 [Haliotis rufescens]
MGNRKSSHKAGGYSVTLPKFNRAWDLVYSGDIQLWSPVAGRYGFDKFGYGCRESDCDRESVCLQYIRAVFSKNKKFVDIERFKQPRLQIPVDDCFEFQRLISAGHELNQVAAAHQDHLVLLVLHHVKDLVVNSAFPLVNLHTRSVTGILAAPRKNMTIIHCDFTPDLKQSAILFYSCSGEMRFCYDLYIYSNETTEILKYVTLNHEVQPYVAFDPRYSWSRIAVANYECKKEGINHELVVFSLDECKTLQRSKLSLPTLFGSSRYNLLYSKDGTLLILQKLTEDRFGVTSYSDIYIFNSDHMRLFKYITSSLPGLFNICRVNYEPVFSKCGSYMRILDHKPNTEDHGVTVQIYQLPRIISLQSQCRIVILNSLLRAEDVQALPLPNRIMGFLMFKPQL